MRRARRAARLALACAAACLCLAACDTPGGQMKADVELLLHGEAGNERQQAARRLGQPGNEGGRAALEQAATNDADPEVRRYAVEALGRVGSRASVPTLLEIARRERDDILIMSTAHALRQIGGPEAVEGVIAVWRTSDRSQKVERVRDLALMGVMRDHPALATPALEPLLRDPLPHLRYLAADALSQIEPPNLRALLEPLKDDPDEAVRDTVGRALQSDP